LLDSSKAEQTVRKRLEYNAVKRINPKMKVGCMAERLKSQFLEEEKIVDLVVGRMHTKIFLTY
jgi:tRNA-2-methylthio-N6-dimethylallyladenosine synthase